MTSWTEPGTGRVLEAPPSRSRMVRQRHEDRRAPATAADYADAAQREQLRLLAAEVHSPSAVEWRRLVDEVHADDYRAELTAAVASKAQLARLARLRRAMQGRCRPNEGEMMALAAADDKIATARARLARGERAAQQAVFTAAGLRAVVSPSAARRGGGSMSGLGDLSRPRSSRRSARRVDVAVLREEIAAWVGKSAAVVASAAPVAARAVCSGCGAPGPVADVRWHESLHRRVVRR